MKDQVMATTELPAWMKNAGAAFEKKNQAGQDVYFAKQTGARFIVSSQGGTVTVHKLPGCGACPTSKGAARG